MERNLAYLLPENLYRASMRQIWTRGRELLPIFGTRTESSSIPMASIKDPKRSAPLSRLCSARFQAPSSRLPPRFRKTPALDAFPGSMDRSAKPPSPKASTQAG